MEGEMTQDSRLKTQEERGKRKEERGKRKEERGKRKEERGKVGGAGRKGIFCFSRAPDPPFFPYLPYRFAETGDPVPWPVLAG